jgi:hypothetical protein
MWVQQTDELFSYHYFGNPEVHVIKHPSKRKSLQAIAFDGICVKALFLAWALQGGIDRIEIWCDD